MKYDITRACGHAERINLFGTNVNGERDNAAKFEETLLCKKCWIEQQNKRLDQIADFELLGSEKQVKWANEILKHNILDAQSDCTGDLVSRFCIQKYYEVASTCTAAQIISKRDDLGYAGISEYMRKCINKGACKLTQDETGHITEHIII